MEKRPIRPEDRWLFRSPGDPQVSPDGKHVAFVLQSVDREADRMKTDIYLVPSDGGEVKQLTNSGKDRSPRWSCDGHTLAFISERSGKPQIWLIDTRGGEAWCLETEVPVMSAPVWSPDGRKIAFTSRVFSHEEEWVPYRGAPEGDRKRAEQQALRELKPDRKDADDKASDVRVITRFRYKFDGIGFYGDRRSQVFVVEVPAERTGPSACGPVRVRQVTSGGFDHEAPSWSPDGNWLAFVSTRVAGADWLEKSDIWCVNVQTGEMAQLLDASGASAAPVFSPDGKSVVYVGHGGRYKGSTSLEVRVFPFNPGNPATEKDVQSLTLHLDRAVGSVPFSDTRYLAFGMPAVWAQDGYIYFILGERGDSFVYRCMPGSRPERVAGEPDHSIAGFSVAQGVIAYQSGSHTEPDEIFSKSEAIRRLTSFNDSVVRTLAICSPERLKWQGPDGWEIDGWIMKPHGYQQDKRYPTVLMVHGGPHGVYGPVFSFQEQMLASNGIAVLYTNPRGSQSYGQQFATACVEDWGGKDFGDLMAAVDNVVNLGIADPDRLGIMGWSYGGYMTCWTITQTQRFKAAITGACISNRHSQYGTGDIVHTAEHHFGGTPWAQPEKLLERSALQHIAAVTTPVLILHGEADLRCPVTQGEEFYTALRRLKKEAVFVRYPGEYHLFRKPSHIEDRDKRVLAWFTYHLGK